MADASIKNIDFGKAICYSGYREGQSPRNQTYPSYEQVVEDLKIVSQQWQYIRIYDASYHADLVLKAVVQEGLPLKVLLGADVGAEQNNPGCPWGANFGEEELAVNRQANDAQIERMIYLAQKYQPHIIALSIGNEASVDWSDHQVPVERLVLFAKRVKQATTLPVTFCENYVPWTDKLKPLAAELDIISVHTYPVWEYQTIDNALAYTRQNYESVAAQYPDKQVIITEAGWTTQANDKGINAWNASQELQAQYCQELAVWSEENNILTFLFEAFDEPWKGSEDPSEPEKHWGFFTVDRKPKLVMQTLYQ